MKGKYSFGKNEKLKSRKQIELLFSQGKVINAAPLRLVYTKPSAPMDTPVKIGVSVSSRNFKKAVDRNRIKRLLRESYRLNKLPLLEHAEKTGIQIAAFIIYTDKTLPVFTSIDNKMQLILKKLISATSEPAPENP